MKPTQFKLVNLSLALLFFCSLSATSHAQSLNENWEEELTNSLEEFLACTSISADNLHCSTFISQSISKVYQVDGLYIEQGKRYLTLQEISQTLNDSKQWTQLGRAYDQKALVEAQSCANSNRAVIAFYNGTNGFGHIALILPGSVAPSGTWGFSVPNSASFFLHEPGKSYIGKGLSYAFSKQMLKDVVLYCRNY